MYSGSTLKQLRTLDMWFGAHQKIDRLARRKIRDALGDSLDDMFPSTKQILQFEGHNGPDAIKRKTPAQDEPWHYYDPYDASDTQLLDIIDNHYANLVAALREGEKTKASFEAAWLAHAVVDGLTPAHHYPYEQELSKLRGGKGIETRNSAKEKLVMHGDTMREKLQNNWRMWGDKGLLATHIAFEAGVALVILPMRYSRLRIEASKKRSTPTEFFQTQAVKVANLHLYEEFYGSGWTPKLAKTVRRELVPIIVSTVACTWECAVREAAKPQKATKAKKISRKQPA